MFEKMSHSKNLLIIGLIAYLFLMFGNNIVTLTHPDEVFYIQTAKEMLEKNNWLVPYMFDKPQFEKPILSFWLFMIAIKFFGLTPFTARFFTALFGIIGVLVTYWCAYMVFRKKQVAALSSVVLSTSFIYIALSRAVLTDMVFSVFVVISIVFFYWGYQNREKKDAGIIWCFVFMGLSVLAKGLLGVVFPVLIICVYLLYKKDFVFLKTRATVFGLLLFSVISIPWHVLMYKWYGQSFIDEYWHNVHVRRIFVAEHKKSNTWYFYLLTMFGGMFPWSLFLIPASYLTGKLIRVSQDCRDKMVFLLIWIFSIFAVVQIAQSKLASYIFPVFPAIAMILGNYFSNLLTHEHPFNLKKSVSFFSILMGLTMIGIAISGIIYGNEYIDVIVSIKPVYFLAFLAVISGVSLIVFGLKKRIPQIISSLGSITAIVLLGVFIMAQHIDPWVSCKKICDEFNKMDVPENSTVLCSKFYVRGIRYYTDKKVAVIDINGKGFFSPHPIPFLNTAEKVVNFLNSQPVTYCVLKEANVKDIKNLAPGRYRVTDYGGIGGKYILKVEKI